MIYGYFDDQRVGTDPAETGTLKPDDLKPAWHGRQKDTAA
jgi:hypothetical protein